MAGKLNGVMPATTPTGCLIEYESTPVEKEKKLLRLFKEIRNYFAAKLEGTSLDLGVMRRSIERASSPTSFEDHLVGSVGFAF